MSRVVGRKPLSWVPVLFALGALSLGALSRGAVGDPPAKESEPVLKKKPKKDDQPGPELPKDEQPDPKSKKDQAKDDEPVLKKKPKKDDDKQDPKNPDPKDLRPLPPAEKPEEILKRVRENMETAEKRLKDKDPGDTTRKIQRDIVRDLDDLINQQQDDQGGGNSSSPPPSGSGGRRDGRPKQRQRDLAKNTGGKGSKENPKIGGDPKGGKDPKSVAGNGGGKGDPNKPKTPADFLRDGDWGRLPAHQRMELDAYARDRFIRDYEPLLQQYYRTIAEQGRRKE